MWQFEQSTGAWRDKTGKIVVHGYSGYMEGCNNPGMQEVQARGPIPRGKWQICAPFLHQHLGPYCLRLLPKKDTRTFGRSGFMIHGDSVRHPGMASLGCVVLPREVRIKVWESGDHTLEVIEGPREAGGNLA